MAQGIERFSAPPPGDEFDPTDEARMRRLLEQFMENADFRVRDLGDDVESLDDRITALEAGDYESEDWDGNAITVDGSDVSEQTTVHTLAAAFPDDVYSVDFVLDWVAPSTSVARRADFEVDVDPDGNSGWTEVQDFHIQGHGGAPNDQKLPLTFVVEGQSMEAGGKIRFSMTGDTASSTWSCTITPLQVRSH